MIDPERADERRRIADAYRAGATIRALAAEHGKSYGWVHRTLSAEKVQMRPRGGRT